MAEITKSGQYREGVDKKLVDILEKAAGMSGYRVEFTSGYRPGDKRQHGKANALDITLIDAQTDKRLPNYQNAENFRTYEEFAQNARGIQRSEYPELDNKFRWGGYFSGPPGKYGAIDLMHFDLAGDRIPMGGGSWKKGLAPQQRNLIPGAVSMGFNDHPVPPGSVPQVATQTSTSAVPTPASVSPQMAFTRQMNVPAFPSITPVPTTTPRSLAKPAQSPSGVNDRLATQGLPPLPQMRPPAPGYKMSGKAAAQDERFMLGSAAKNPTTQPRVASLGPMAPIPAPRPGTATLPTSVVQDTFASLGMPMQPQAPTRVADLYAGILPATPSVPRPAIGQTYAGQDRNVPQLPRQMAPVPAVRSAPPPPIGQTYAGQDTNVPRTISKTVMVANPAYKPSPLSAPGAGLTEAQMRAIRGDMSMVAPKPPVVPQFIPQTVSVPNPAYLAAPSLPKLPATPPTVPQPQGGGGLLGMLGGAIQNFDLEGMKRNIAGALAPAILGSVAGRTALIDPMIARMFTRQVNQPMAGKTIQTANSGQQVIGQRVNNSPRGRTVSQNSWFNDVTGV